MHSFLLEKNNCCFITTYGSLDIKGSEGNKAIRQIPYTKDTSFQHRYALGFKGEHIYVTDSRMKTSILSTS